MYTFYTHNPFYNQKTVENFDKVTPNVHLFPFLIHLLQINPYIEYSKKTFDFTHQYVKTSSINRYKRINTVFYVSRKSHIKGIRLFFFAFNFKWNVVRYHHSFVTRTSNTGNNFTLTPSVCGKF